MQTSVSKWLKSINEIVEVVEEKLRGSGDPSVLKFKEKDKQTTNISKSDFHFAVMTSIYNGRDNIR